MSAQVLIVDDEEPVRRNFRALLEDAGHTVWEAVDSAQGLDQFLKHQPDIVLTDMRMHSGRDGLELISAIRARDEDMPVVVVSGSGTLQDAIDAIRRGAWDYLVKPVQLSEELLVAIDRNLERARLLRENRRYRSKLEEMVDERTASLLAAREQNQALQTRLLHAQKLETLGLLAGGIAHDFNNVLLSVRFGVDEIRRARPGADLEEAFSSVEDALKRAADLTRQIFVFAGRAPSNPVSCDVSALITGMEKLFRSAMRGRVELRTELAAVPPILVDLVQLQQIVMNLILNGAEAIPGRGVVTVKVGLSERLEERPSLVYLVPPAQGGAHVSLVVEDTGSGIDEATLRRIGDPFFTTKARGQGLGLTTVVGSVRGLGGALAVESTVGRGTRFSVALPIVRIAVRAEPPRSILGRA